MGEVPVTCAAAISRHLYVYCLVALTFRYYYPDPRTHHLTAVYLCIYLYVYIRPVRTFSCERSVKGA